jgi:hypothetical protein
MLMRFWSDQALLIQGPREHEQIQAAVYGIIFLGIDIFLDLSRPQGRLEDISNLHIISDSSQWQFPCEHREDCCKYRLSLLLDEPCQAPARYATKRFKGPFRDHARVCVQNPEAALGIILRNGNDEPGAL